MDDASPVPKSRLQKGLVFEFLNSDSTFELVMITNIETVRYDDVFTHYTLSVLSLETGKISWVRCGAHRDEEFLSWRFRLPAAGE